MPKFVENVRVLPYELDKGDIVHYYKGPGEPSKETVTKVWPQMSPHQLGYNSTCPGVNLSNGECSVPHYYAVQGATGRFYVHPYEKVVFD